MHWGIRRTPEQLGHKVASSKKKFRIKSSYERETEKLRKLEKEMKQKEEITRRKNALAEREARLNDLGKSEQTLQNERDAAEKRRQQAEAKAAKKQADAEKKAAKREAAQEKKAAQREADAAKKKARQEAAEERKEKRKIEEEEAEVKRNRKKLEEDARNSRKIADMTDDELRAVINRLNLEKQYKQAAGIKEKKSAAKVVKGVLAGVGGTLVKSANDALGTVSKKVITEALDLAVEKLSGGEIESERTKRRKKESGGSGGGSGGGST